jgi:hypothetical protein
MRDVARKCQRKCHKFLRNSVSSSFGENVNFLGTQFQVEEASISSLTKSSLVDNFWQETC